jgi:S-adenosylmethionine hydrolase
MPIITLSTDIGQQDFIVGAFKGQLLSVIPEATITDITHYLPLDNFAHAAYICKNAFPFYPTNTLHILLLNVFDESTTHFVISKFNNQYILCPNNGILSMITETIPDNTVVLPMVNATNIIQITEQISNAATLILHQNNMNEIGTNGLRVVEKQMMKPTIGNDWIEGQILFIDNFGNAIINITKEVFEKERRERNYKIVCKRNEILTSLSTNYSYVNEGNFLAWFNAAGYLELAINKGNAAELFGLENFNVKMHSEGKGIQNKWFYQTVRIFFE